MSARGDARRLRQVTAAALAVAVAGGGLAGCGGADNGGPTRLPTIAPTAVAAPSPAAQPRSRRTTAAPRRSPTPIPTAAVLADGRHAVRITSIDPDAQRVVVDVVQFFTGAAAAKAAAEDGSSNVPPPNDYWIRNGNRRLRTLDVTPDARITVNVAGAEESGDATQDIPWTLTKLAAVEGLADGLFWVTVRDAQVVRIAEQYLP